MCCHISTKTAYPEPATIGAEAVETATVPDDDHTSSSSGSVKVFKGKNDGESYSKLPAGSGSEEEVYDGPSKKSGQGDVEITGGLEMYKLTDADTKRFKDIIGKSSCIEPNPNLIMLAI